MKERGLVDKELIPHVSVSLRTFISSSETIFGLHPFKYQQNHMCRVVVVDKRVLSEKY